QTVPRDDVEGMAALRRLRVACRAAKELLSSSPDTTVEVILPHLSTSVPIRRADLENDIRPSLMAAVDAAAQTIAAAGLAPADVHVALLVGGSSRIPLFGELVSSRLGLPIVADPFPELTVALGAALFGDDGPPPPPPPVGAGARDDPDAHDRDEPGPGAADDVGALAAWFADPAADTSQVPAPGPAPGAAMPWDDLPEAPPLDDGAANAGAWDATAGNGGAGDDAWDPAGDDAWDPAGDDAWEPTWDADEGEAPADATRWEGGEWTESVGHWGDVSAAPASSAARRVVGPTTGETDLWGPPARRRRRSDGNGVDDGAAAPSGTDQADGTNPRLIAAIIGGALAVVGIAGAALATGIGGADDPQLTLADPARSALTTTSMSTTTSMATTTTSTSTTTTTTEPEPEEEWEPPPPPPTEPPTTAPTTTSTTAPPTTTTTEPPTTTTTEPPTTTTCPGHPGPPSTTTTTPGGCD
ncbi:MAG: Hsp70 family protein, partial [Acidimicrobiales bacterium]